MAATGLKRRLDALEKGNLGASAPWVRILQYEGQSVEEATAVYEAKNGPIVGSNCILRVIIRKPGIAHA